MAYTKVKREVPICHHDEEITPITVIFIDEKGRYRHGEGCAEKLDCLGTCQAVGNATEVRFFCPSCLETVTLPLTALGRVVWLGKGGQGRREGQKKKK